MIGVDAGHMSSEGGPPGPPSSRIRLDRAAAIGSALILSIAMLVAFGSPAAAAPITGGYDAAYAGESVFTSTGPGDRGQMSAIFFNAGTQPWSPGVVSLLVCLADKITCNVPSPNSAYARDWYSPTAYATVAAPVLPGQNGFFVYTFQVPLSAPPGTTVTFNGDVGLTATGALLHPSGYYQQNTVARATGLSVSAVFDADPIAADAVSTAALTVMVVDPSGRPDGAFIAGTITVTRTPASASFCRITDVPNGRMAFLAADGSFATIVGESGQFVVTSTTFPGICSIEVTTTNIPATGAVAQVTTKIIGPANKLGIAAGGASTHPASVTGACTIFGVAGGSNDNPSCTVVVVDVQDINGNRVTADSTRVVTATLDPATCSGGARGGVNIAAGSTGSASTTDASVTVSRGRATFVLASPGAYPACRVSFTTPGLAGASTTEVWTPN